MTSKVVCGGEGCIGWMTNIVVSGGERCKSESTSGGVRVKIENSIALAPIQGLGGGGLLSIF